MSRQETLNHLAKAVYDFDKEAAKSAAQKALRDGINPLEALTAVTGAAKEVGERFSRAEIFLAELIQAADVMRSAIDILRPALGEQARGAKLGKVVIGTVEGDIHDLGKNIVGTMLAAEGFEVKDIGVNCSPDKFLNEAENLGADIIGMSCLLTSTVPSMKEAIEFLVEEGVRSKYKVIVGGAILSEEVAREIGADGYGKDAVEAVKLARRLLQ